MLSYAIFPPPRSPMLPRGFVPRLGSKRKQRQAPSPRNTSREDARREWRRRVDEAAQRYGRAHAATEAYFNAASYRGIGYAGQGLIEGEEGARLSLVDALAAPKPWRKERAK